MYNAFLVIRTVFFALLTYFHVLVLVFASWNIVAAQSLGMQAPGATVFLMIGSVIIFMLVPAAYLAEVICIKARPAQVRLECGWTALMSLFQLGKYPPAASIDVTVNGPPMHCQANSPWAMCASSSLLVHISWLLTLIIFAYFLVICVSAATHASSLPDVWVTPVPHVPWFSQGAAPVVTSELPTLNHSKTSSSTSSDGDCAVGKYITEQWGKLSGAERQPTSSGPILFQSGRQSGDPTQPTWAREQLIRRGVDAPFANPQPTPRLPPAVVMSPTRTFSRLSAAIEETDTADVESQQEMMARTPSSLTLASSQTSVFPRRITNPDLPIPRPNVSQWIRADAVSWVSLRTQRSVAV